MPLVVYFYELEVVAFLGTTLRLLPSRVPSNDGKPVVPEQREKPLGEDHVLFFERLLSLLFWSGLPLPEYPLSGFRLHRPYKVRPRLP